MDVPDAVPACFRPFQKCSVNLLCAPTFVGKSFFVTQAVRRRQLFFAGNQPSRIVVVHCSSRNRKAGGAPPEDDLGEEGSGDFFELPGDGEAPGEDDCQWDPSPPPPDGGCDADLRSSLSGGEIPQLDLDLEDFGDPLAVLRRGDLVIFEDLQKITWPVQETVNKHTHHLELCSTFLICQALIGTKLFALAQLIHNVILLLHSNAVARFANYLVTVFFFDPELRALLRQILGHAQSHDHTVWLEVNSVAGKSSTHLALSAVEQLFPPREEAEDGDDDDDRAEKKRRREEWRPFCLFFPQPHLSGKLRKKLEAEAEGCGPGETRLAMARKLSPDMREVAASLAKAGDDFPEAFMLVPAERVCREAERCDRESEEAGSEAGSLPEDEAGKEERTRRAERQKWEQLMALIEREVEDTFDSKRWRPAKLLARQVMRNPDFGVSDDGQLLKFKSGNAEPVSLVDFLIQCTRPKAPSEKGESAQKFGPFVHSLLQHHMPESFVRNRSVLEAARKSRRCRAEARRPNKSARGRKKRPASAARKGGGPRRKRRAAAASAAEFDSDFDDFGYPPASRFGSRPFLGGCPHSVADPYGDCGRHRHRPFYPAY
jgi:hypothetical protein